ncbi:serine/threonine-protein phosphatase 1 regulatory subunit 10 isoform X1 [Athalia rosae]|uniref:serine/threonine-protein phosphatase 1 regulatory subunit 10 isoform X1 n=3 Tax=Athalia rosae TaxID=37344 RepID=UPI00203470B9|nr:serine/threonine-protein phosphatase 1 regulatory subunit 10 isoform X1 [Athalia rosae]XP_020708301.2 serine/threonine-protein phosphatase 1 regulatory subunit 10 isoform X1 [Athalia rosae]
MFDFFHITVHQLFLKKDGFIIEKIYRCRDDSSSATRTLNNHRGYTRVCKMPRIDPLQLLKCLSVLLGPTGGIKSNEEVQRLASLMTKFSKKLVSKCIYIQILKTTNTEILGQFMGAGGWNLVHMWLTDGILAKNWALIQELLELLLLCPVDIERLKTNNCPKLIKGLSKEGSHHVVRVLAGRLVEQWLKIVKGEAAPNSVPADIMTLPIQALIGQNQSLGTQQHFNRANASADPSIENGNLEDCQIQTTDFAEGSSNALQQQLQRGGQQGDLQLLAKNPQQQQKQYFLVPSSQQQQQQQSLPVYKITIRDGKQVLAKVETDPANINNVLSLNNDNRVNGDNMVDSSEQDNDIGTLVETIQGSLMNGQDLVIDNSVHLSSEVKESLASPKDVINELNHEEGTDNNRDSKTGVGSESSKSKDKENRDSHKKDDKKSNGSSDKKLSSHSSSSRSSSKHGSSSHRTSSSSHKSGSHRSSSGGSKGSSSKEKLSSRDTSSSKDKDRHRTGSSGKHSSSSTNSKGAKSDRDKDKEREKEKLKKDQAEKDKATLEKVQGQALSTKMGKIPKKRAEDDTRQSTERKSSISPSRKLSTESKDGTRDKKSLPEKKNISMSIESRKTLVESSRPKTVKTFNSKFRSTGLEEEVKPPPPRSVKKASASLEKKLASPKLPVLKRPSPPRENIPLPDKRARLSLDSPTTPPPSDEKKGAIKLIPPRPKPMVLQESDMFMDALTASTKSKEPRKRKRRTSLSKDGAPDPKKQDNQTEGRDATPPPSSPLSSDEKSPVVVKPNFKFYQDTLETDEDKEKKDREKEKESEKDGAGESDKRDRDESGSADDKEFKESVKEGRENQEDEEGDERSTTPTPDDEVEDAKDARGPSSPAAETNSESLESSRKDKGDSSPAQDVRYVNGLKSVLLVQKRKGPKKSLKWKTELESIRYFELDETERVNVTKTFTDAKQMEKQNEREAFQMARKLSTEDLMEEKTIWKALIPVDLPPALVEYGKNSREKDVQYAREKGILQALYFNRSMIPDSAAEPDEERHPMTDPKVIPLEDLTGNKESEKDFTSMAWPEPKPQLFQASVVPAYPFPPYPHNQQAMMGPMGHHGPASQMGQIPQQMMGPGPMGPMGQMGPMVPMTPDMGGSLSGGGGGGWRTGDGKVVVPDAGMQGMQGGYPPGPDAPMGPPGMMGPPMFNQADGFGMMGPADDMGYGPANMGNNYQGPPGSAMYGPGPNYQGGARAGPMRGGPGGPGGMGCRGGPGPGWYRSGGGGGGGGGSNSGRGGGWRGNGKQPPICRQFSKNGYCRAGEKCQYLHPGVNCPPF